MLTINNNTEKRLFKDLDYLRREHPNTRCVYLRFSELEKSYITWRPMLMEILKAHFEDDVCDIYFCKDHDVFITSHSFTQKHLKSLLGYLKDGLGNKNLDELAILFEVKINWKNLHRLCQLKEQTARNIELGVLRQNNPVKTKPKPLNFENIPTAHIETLQKRREERDDLIIMAVEDDSFMQRLLRCAIGTKYDQRKTLRMCDDGESAIPTYVREAPDVLLLDIDLPGISGHKVLEEILKIDKQAHVIMFSSYGDRDNVLKAMDLGAKCFVGKPFSSNKLFKSIEDSPYISKKVACEHIQ